MRKTQYAWNGRSILHVCVPALTDTSSPWCYLDQEHRRWKITSNHQFREKSWWRKLLVVCRTHGVRAPEKPAACLPCQPLPSRSPGPSCCFLTTADGEDPAKTGEGGFGCPWWGRPRGQLAWMTVVGLWKPSEINLMHNTRRKWEDAIKWKQRLLG